MQKLKNEFTYLTAMERESLSNPARFLLKENLLRGKILDFGCGVGKDVELLQEKHFDIVGYDPYYFPTYPKQKFDTIICIYVLNVLMAEEQPQVLMEVSHLLKPDGKAYYAVRRDLEREGFREHYRHKKPTYQCHVELPFNSIGFNQHYEIYEYTHYNREPHASKRCIFCNPRKNLTLLTESATAYALLDGYPISQGHALIIPKRHEGNFFKLDREEQAECWLMANKVQEIISKEFKPDGFNMGVNIGQAAGQKVMHCAIHLIPRYKGDTTARKKGGIRRVIPKA